MSSCFVSSAQRAFLISFLIFISYSMVFPQWVLQNSNTAVQLQSVFFLDANTGFAAGKGSPPVLRGEILRTSDGGITWQTVFADTSIRPNCIKFINSQTGFAIGGFFASQFRLFKTSNNGINWYPLCYIEGYYGKYSVDFVNDQTGYACGIWGTISKTTNGGVNWQLQYQLAYQGNCFLSVDFVNETTGWCAGDSGRIVKTTNGGTNWFTQLSTVSNNLRGIYMLNVNTGYIAAEGALILKTVNSGQNWMRQYLPTAQHFTSVYFTDAVTGYVCGGRGEIYKTTDEGNIWFLSYTDITDSLKSIYFVNAYTGYAAGDNGRIIKTTTGGVLGIKPISGIVPESYMLYQNYPNPFNPNTKIKFDIPSAGQRHAFDVRIIIYDILGREIATLVNETLQPGTYEVEWDGSNYTSGIYFYKLISDDYIQSRRMVLLK